MRRKQHPRYFIDQGKENAERFLHLAEQGAGDRDALIRNADLAIRWLAKETSVPVADYRRRLDRLCEVPA